MGTCARGRGAAAGEGIGGEGGGVKKNGGPKKRSVNKIANERIALGYKHFK